MARRSSSNPVLCTNSSAPTRSANRCTHLLQLLMVSFSSAAKNISIALGPSPRVRTSQMNFVEENLRHTLFTWTTQKNLSPLALAGGEGAWFWDTEGRRYLDLASVAVSANAGHNHPRILAAMRRQLD